jgi:ATP-dependent helicase/DNAse subunit B
MFELFRNEDFDFDKEYQKAISEYDFPPSALYTLNHSYKEQVKAALNAIKEREKRYSNPKIENEKKFVYSLTPNTTILGFIDNFVTLNDKYFICIDYKTGSTKFDDKYIQYGLSSQLPTYALLVTSSKEYKDYVPVGLFINNVISNSTNIVIEDDELIPSHLKLNGKVLGDLSVITLIDPTIADGDSSFISGVRIKKDGELTGAATVSNLTFGEYMTTVKELYLKMDEELRKNNFDISPVYKGERDTACNYCQYKDVCFVRNKQFRRLVEDSDE